ncbi:MAG: Unknown protein [uncultured Sulfurovum sp.]|uniref:Uncharacterized protein n=1 Tax=uncultured Sulfurovum sp. TaxID=269237 RepID=A0A6S6TJ77_9BACT|nr:MAG: Unknown protein [uncultured Sulfurovum sp.]
MKNLILLLIFHSLLAAEENRTLSLNIFNKAKASIKNEIVTAKISLNARTIFGSYFHDLEENKDRKYISKIMGKVEGQKVLELYFSPFVYVGRLYIHFKFKDFSPSTNKIDYFVVENENNMAKKSFKIKRKLEVKNEFINKKQIKSKLLEIDSKVWTLSKVDDIIKNLYGEKSLKTLQDNCNNYTIERNCTTYNGICTQCKKKTVIQYIRTPVFMKFDSSKELDSIIILYTGKKYPLQAVYKIPPQSIPYIGVTYSFEKSGEIIIIARGKDQKIYQSKPYFIELSNARDTENRSINMLFNIK